MIKPDAWIRRQCIPPTHAVVNTAGNVVQFVTAEDEDHLETIAWRCKRTGTSDLKACDEQMMVQGDWKPMITPFEPNNVREVDGKRIVSYGTSSYGYDVRLDNKFKVFTNVHSEVIDPLNFSEKCFVEKEGDYVIIPPNSYLLGSTIETFCIPRNVMVIAVGKSTWARAGAIVNVTPIEPGFAGSVVVEISNSTPLPMKIHAGHGIAQFLFFESDEACEISYADKGGKYQNQKGVVTPKM